MHAGLQPHIAFHLTGRRLGSDLDPIDGLGLRPALLAEYADLTKLRYDFPLVLVERAEGAASVQSLSGLFDAALDAAAVADGDRLRKHALRIEREIRTLAGQRGVASFADAWNEAVRRLATDGDAQFADSASRLRAALKVEGSVVDCDRNMPFGFLHHVWKAVQAGRASLFREQVDKLITRLSEILRADQARSPHELNRDRLKASVGATHRDSFDFAAMARLLAEALPKASLPEARRRRIDRTLSVLQSQRFFPAAGGAAPGSATEPYSFVFGGCAEAIAAYQARLPEMLEFAKSMAIASLEIDGAYVDAKHDAFFAEFGGDDVDPEDAGLFPDYLICVRASDMQAADTDMILEAMSAGMRAKVLVLTDDVLEPSPVGGAHLGFGLRGKQLASTAIGLATSYVLQSSSSNLFRFREQVLRGLTYPGPALFNVFVGPADATLPPYLIAAAAMESRAFPAFAYDPSAGSDWASRFTVSDNPQADRDWPVHGFAYEDEACQRIDEQLPFTLIDFIACDRRYAKHFARVPRAQWNASLTPASEFLASEPHDLSEQVPCVLMVDGSNVLHRVIVDDKLLREARHCAAMWRSLQESGGIHNSHAARLLAREREAWSAQASAEAKARGNGHAAPDVITPSPAVAAAAPAPAEPETRSDDPYIETARCTSCNECTQINDKMFAYNENKQAYIADPDAGTYAQLVEAAESCQVSIIHPGKPRNPSEPGLEELKKRAESFL